MNTGNHMKNQSALSLCRLAMISFFMCCSIAAHAIDNPDAPDYVGDFMQRAQRHELNIQQTTQTTQSYITAYAAYEKFLDQELNAAYAQLMTQLNDKAQQNLRASQRKWLKYRNAEFSFITQNWTRENFGSSSVISRGDYRTRLIKNRVVTLLQYLKNY